MTNEPKHTYKLCLSCAICIAWRGWPGGLNTGFLSVCADPFVSCLLTPDEQEMIIYALFAIPTSVRTI